MVLTEIRIEGLRTLADVRLPLSGLTVVIGESGSGKSSLIEACQLLRSAASPDFFKELRRTHWGFAGLLRQGAPHLKLGVRIAEAHRTFDYEFALAPRGEAVVILEDKLTLGADKELNERRVLLGRNEEGLAAELERGLRQATTFFPLDGQALLAHANLYELSSPHHSEFRTAQNALQAVLFNIQVHLPFEVMPSWGSKAFSRRSALREENLLDTAEVLEPLGSNLANAFYALRNEQGETHWRETLELVRLGLGDEVEDIQVRIGSDGGKITLRIKYRGLTSPVPTFALSDGTLAYLAFVAMYRLRPKHGPALLAFDEPELHLHPHLLMRVLDFFESMGQSFPVLLATHSDRLLDGLSHPAESVVLCELDEERRTKLRRPDPEALRSWLERYRGIGDLRAQGHDASIWKADEEPR